MKRGPRILTILILSLFALALFAFGSFTLWNQHFGVPARVTINHCSAARTNPQHGGYRRNWYSLMPGDCIGHPSGGAPDQGSITVYDAQWSDVNHDIDVHIVKGLNSQVAIKDGSWWPLIIVGIGLLFGVGAVTAIVRRLRRAPPT